MPAPREPIFLGRDTYRRRRLIDALRFLPIVGFLLFLSPLLGGGDASEPRSTALGVMFLFSVWFGLIVITMALVRLLARGPDGVGADPMEPEPRSDKRADTRSTPHPQGRSGS
ncbi:MAG: hypothetical protein P8X50_11270, partial [Maritimibacter sp.]